MVLLTCSVNAFIHVLDPGMAGADSSVFPSPAEMTTAVGCWCLRSTSRCLNMTAVYLFVAERKIRIVGEEGDWLQLAKALEESELEAEFDGRSLLEDIVNCCSFAHTHDLPSIARPFPLISSISWTVLAVMEETKGVDGKGAQAVLAVGLIFVG